MDKKDLIIETAIELFAAQGIEKTSINMICEQSSVSKGLVFHHFKNKNELLKEVFMRMDRIISDVNSSIDQSLPAKEKFVQLLEKIFTAMASDEHQIFYRLHYQLSTQPAIRSFLADLIEARRKVMVNSIESILTEISGVDEDLAGQMIVAEIDGIAFNYVFATSDFPLDEIKDLFIKKHLLSR